jgi:hypothetical protein
VIKKDYIQRMIEQLVQALARLLKLTAAGQHKEAIELVRTTSQEAFGIEYELLIGVDAASAAGLLGSPIRVRKFAELVRAEAGALEASGNAALAGKRREFADALVGFAGPVGG